MGEKLECQFSFSTLLDSLPKDDKVRVFTSSFAFFWQVSSVFFSSTLFFLSSTVFFSPSYCQPDSRERERERKSEEVSINLNLWTLETLKCKTITWHSVLKTFRLNLFRTWNRSWELDWKTDQTSIGTRTSNRHLSRTFPCSRCRSSVDESGSCEEGHCSSSRIWIK